MSISSDFDFLIQWHLTERCNLNCRHCYQSGNRERELSLNEIREVIDEIAEMLAAWQNSHGISFSPSFNLTGGEPLLRPDFFTILEAFAPYHYDLFVLSNGTLIDGKSAARLKELGVAGVQVSLEGPEAIHDSIRGSGSFAATVTGVRHLLRAGLPVTLNATLSRLNMHATGDMTALAASLGVQRFGLARLVPAGRGADMLSDMLTTREVHDLYEELFTTPVPGLQIVSGDPVAAQMAAEPAGDAGCTPYGGCAAGVSGLTILADGTIVPCRRLPIPIGNVRQDALREVWATSEVLARLREKSLYGGKCATCERWSGCRGCRGVAYAYAQANGCDDYLAEDPQCFLK
ncbi:MAG TPA: radical SAM protein [Geobacteraceae bacterium]